MASGKAKVASEVNTNAYAFLNELEIGKQSQVKLMICRSWDTHTVYGRYLSTDFIASDEKGNIIQLTAKSNVAHHFIARLKDGVVYLLHGFDVIANRTEYRIMKDNSLMIELTGSTFLRRQSTSDTTGFTRHPFNCIELEDLEPTMGKFVVDVVGYAVNIGAPDPHKAGSNTLEFDLANERGKAIRTTLWGSLGPAFLERQPSAPASYYILLSSVTVKQDAITLSSTSATLLIDDLQIPALSEFKQRVSAIETPVIVQPSAPGWQLPPPTEGTLRELLDMTGDAFKCKVEIVNIRMKNFWYYNTCSVCQARKGLERRSGHHWCESCQANVPEPITRFRVICDVRDETAKTVIVLFDDTAETLTKSTAKALLAEVDEETCNTVLPNALANLLGTTQLVLLKTASYYDQGPYESFNCIKVYVDELVPTEQPSPTDMKRPALPGSTSSSVVAPAFSTPKAPKRAIEVPTPAKDLERSNRRKFVVTTDSEDEDPADEDSQPEKESVCSE
ncbi:replication factor A protein 1-like [Rutidosis leptorrhynchoides]|uniref:replication factor A protein 1-like n=2 Tax=Rutidosis leptorrhynchoides TaxID=125765 RepID=UPI003A9972BA